MSVSTYSSVEDRDDRETDDDGDEAAPLSCRDPRHAEASKALRGLDDLLKQLDEPTRAFYHAHIEGTPLLALFEEDLVESDRIRALNSILDPKRACFRRNPSRLSKLLANVLKYYPIAQEQLDALGLPRSKQQSALSNIFYGITKYSGSLYT